MLDRHLGLWSIVLNGSVTTRSGPGDTSSPTFSPCVIIPTYNNPLTIEAVVRAVRMQIDDVIVVDDGSDEPGREACEALQAKGLATLVQRATNGGKGAAVKTGFEAAAQHGFTHALQIDADGQHDLQHISEFLAAAERAPEAFIIGYPQYDESVPKHRLIARRLTNFWVNLEVGGKGIVRDAMVGFRVYPVNVARALDVRGDRMDFDIEIAVRIAWLGIPIINLPVNVRYLSAEDGGVSHFQPLWDNLRFASLHSRLCTGLIFRWMGRRIGVLPK